MKHPLAHQAGIALVFALATGMVKTCPCGKLAAVVDLENQRYVGYQCPCGHSWRQKASAYQRRARGVGIRPMVMR